jgi:hypothetical protein
MQNYYLSEPPASPAMNQALLDMNTRIASQRLLSPMPSHDPARLINADLRDEYLGSYDSIAPKIRRPSVDKTPSSISINEYLKLPGFRSSLSSDNLGSEYFNLIRRKYRFDND